ncbi:hypothetical protein O1611_g10418 [Lasiodiplodia mahajangana]|uniref:Uncharacterized protein n=1 Tax=Lasiodiplodia mahajangana TaxID=1108764 RepID=A0ACC2IYG3_9PEZI|nr:hypothetical protein O1611_g10418 [Lasiodiplodia mahajangana]
MPTAGRIVRRFSADTTVEELYAFVECYDILATNPELNGEDKREESDREDDVDLPAEKPEGYVHEYGFRIASPMPRAVYEPDKTASLRERIGRSGNLIVELGTADSDSESEAEQS